MEREFHDKMSYKNDDTLKYEVIKIAKQNKFNLDREAIAMLSVTNSTKVCNQQ